MEKKNTCRCCLLRPPDRSLKKPYSRSGKTEIYSNMLKECFEIHLTLITGDCGICEVCVGRLRDASDFKLQVQRSQEELQEWLQGDWHVKEGEDSPKPEKVEDYAAPQEELIHFYDVEVKTGPPSDPIPISENDEFKTFFSEGEDSPKPEKVEDDAAPQEELIHFYDVEVKTGPPSDPIPISENDEFKTFFSDFAVKVKTEVTTSILPINENDEGKDFSSDMRNQIMVQTCEQEPVQFTGHSSKSPCNITESLTHDIKRKNSNKPFTCNICVKHFARKARLKIHERTHYKKKLTCETCKKEFKKKSLLNRHSLTHTGERHIVCEICGRRFATNGCLYMHKSSCIQDKRYSCNICKTRFKDKDSLVSHMNTHTGPKKFRCKICSVKFIDKCRLRKHIRKVHNMDTCYTCDVCSKSFSDKSEIIRHLKTHFRGKKQHFTCGLCGLKLANKNSLRRHNQIHTGERSHSCEMCNKSFRNKYVLNTHKLTHTGDKPHCCEICGKQFASRNNFSVHLKTHVKGVTYACQLCAKSYSTSEGLRQHKRTHLKNKNVPKPRSKKRKQKVIK